MPTILSDGTGHAEFQVKIRDSPVNRESGTDPSSMVSATEERGQPALAPATAQRQEQAGLRKGKPAWAFLLFHSKRLFLLLKKQRCECSEIASPHSEAVLPGRFRPRGMYSFRVEPLDQFLIALD